MPRNNAGIGALRFSADCAEPNQKRIENEMRGKNLSMCSKEIWVTSFEYARYSPCPLKEELAIKKKSPCPLGIP